MCHFNPTQAITVEKEAINMLLTTMIRMACRTDKPIASVMLAIKTNKRHLLYPTQEGAWGLPIREVQR
jgi:hypothetical protein